MSAVSFADKEYNNGYLIVVGLENGELSIFEMVQGEKEVKITQKCKVQDNISHCDNVKRIKF